MFTILGYIHFANMLLNGGSLLMELSQDGTFNGARFSATLGWFCAWLSVIGRNEN